MRRRGRWSTVLGGLPVLCVIAGVIMLVGASPSGAHASLQATDPPDGARLDRAPAEVTLEFNESVSVAPDGVRLLSASGPLPLPGPPSASGAVVRAPLPVLPDAASYLVAWTVVSADGHPISGSFVFSVGDADPGEAAVLEAESRDGQDHGVGTWRAVANVLTAIGLLGGLGSVVFALSAPRLPPSGQGHVRRSLVALGVVGVVVSGVVARAGTPAVEPATWLALLATVTALALLLPRPRWWRAAGAAVVGGLALAAVGHTRTASPAWLIVGADAVHVAAGAIWTGGVLALGLAVHDAMTQAPPGSSGSAVVAPPLAEAVRRFSTIAAASVVALAGSGALLAWRITGPVTGWAASDHGRTLLVKLGLVALAVACGAYNRFVLVPRVEEPPCIERLGRVLRIELVLLVAVIGVTGVLVDRSPNTDAAPTPRARISQAASFEGGQALVTVERGSPGRYDVTIELRDAAGYPLEPWREPEVEARLGGADLGAIRRSAHQMTPLQWHTAVELPVPGRWELTVVLRTSRYEQQRITVDVPSGS